MRRVLPFAVVLGVLAWVAAPALSLEPYAPEVTEFELAPPGSASARTAGGPVTLPAMRAPKRFDLVGLRWTDAREVEVELRVRRDGGRWSRWFDVGHAENGERGSPPLLTGGTDDVQVRLDRRPRGLRVHFVNATGTADRGSRVLTTLRRAANTAVIAALSTPATATPRQAAGAPPVVDRAQWDPGNQCRPRSSSGIGEVKFAMVHHTVTSNLYAKDDGPSMVLAICRYHRNGNGWTDIGYNFLVDRYGTIYEGRAGGIDQAVVGAQAQGFNAVSTGISNLGTFESAGQTPEGLRATARIAAWKLGVHGAPVTGEVSVRSGGGSASRYPAGRMVTFERISGHRDGGLTACPGAALYAQLPELRRLAQQAPAVLPSAPGPTTPVPSGAVSLEAPARTVVFGQPAQVGGRATTNDGGPLAGAEIRVQVRTASRWQTAARATSGPDGGWLAALPTQRNREVRALAYITGVRAATSGSMPIAVQPLIRVRAAKRVVARQPLVVSGRVRPAKTKLILEIAREGSDANYRTVARVPIRVRTGTFRVVTRLRHPALHRLRVTFRGDRTNAAARSGDVVLRAIRPRAAGGGAQAKP
jgi:hypothetical protein